LVGSLVGWFTFIQVPKRPVSFAGSPVGSLDDLDSGDEEFPAPISGMSQSSSSQHYQHLDRDRPSAPGPTGDRDGQAQ